jgi:hypothetical protein
MSDFHGTEKMSISLGSREYDLLGIRMQSRGEWGMCFHGDGKESPGNFAGSQPDKTACLHALDETLDLFALITGWFIQDMCKNRKIGITHDNIKNNYVI